MVDFYIDDDDCPCKEEVEKEEAIALAKAMEISSQDPPKPIVPGLTPMDTEEVITIRIQPDVSFLQRLTFFHYDLTDNLQLPSNHNRSFTRVIL